MANHERGEVEFEAQGKAWILRLGINELISVQGAVGIADKDEEFLQALDNLSGSFRQMRAVVYHGLKGAHPEITELQAGEIVTAIGRFKMAALVVVALRWALPEKEPTGAPQEGGGDRPSGGPTS